jgi:hypothetical protein
MAKGLTVTTMSGAVGVDARLALPVLVYGAWIVLQVCFGPRFVYRLHQWRGATPAEASAAERAFRRRLAERIESLVTIS